MVGIQGLSTAAECATGGRAMAPVGNGVGRAPRKQKLLDALAELWPSLPFMAFGLWTAWSSLTYSGSLWLSDNEVDGTYLSQLYNVSTLFGGATFIVAALLGFKGKAAAFVSDRTVKIGGLAACLGCLAIIAVGPYYLKSYLSSEVVRSIFWVSSAVTGVGTVLIGLRCGVLYGSLPPRRILIYAALSQLVASFVYLLTFACPDWAPIEHGPSLASILFFCGLPPAAAVLACVRPCKASGAGELAEVVRGADAPTASASSDQPAPSRSRAAADGASGRLRLPTAYWRFAVFTLFISLLTSMPRAAVVTTHALVTTFEGSNLLMVLRVIMSIAVIVYALRADARGVGFGKICSLLATVSAVATACVSAFGGLSSGLSLVVYFAANVFEFVMWCLLAFIVVQKRLSAVVVFGTGRGLFMAGCGLGWMLGSTVLPLVDEGTPTTVLFIAIAGIMLLLALGLFSEKDYERLFSPVSEEELSLEDLFDLDRRQRELESGPKTEKRGRFSRAIEAVSQEYALSARESEVLRCLAMGYGSDRIADTMQVKVNTVRAHTHNVYVKLDVHSREELMRLVDDAVAKQ